jgi:hypothetical protein
MYYTYSNVICKTIKSGPWVGDSCVQELGLVTKLCVFVAELPNFRFILSSICE